MIMLVWVFGDVSFNFVEIGSAKDQNTLEMNGFINVSFTPSTNMIPMYDPRPQSAVSSGMTSSDENYGVENIKFNVDPFTGDLVLFNGEVLTEGANFVIDRYGGNLIFDTPEELETNIFILNTSTGTLYIDT